MLLSLVVAMGTGCGDDNAVTTEVPMDTSTTTGDATDTTPPPPDTTGSTTAVVDDTGTTSTGTTTTTTGDTDTTTTGDTDTTTGGEALPGQTQSQLVSSGERASNRNFTLVYTFGQPSSLQSTHTSPNFRLQGGLIGANGSPP